MENNYHFDQVRKAIEYLANHFEEQPSLEEVAAHIHLSKYHFQRLFSDWVGVSPKQFLQAITIEHAKRLLLEGETTLQTAYEVGLSGTGRLHDLFVKIAACTPGEFKQRGAGLRIQYEVADSPFGRMLIAETERGLCKVVFLEKEDHAEEHLQLSFPNANLQASGGPNGQLLKAYFSNWKQPKQHISIDLQGTPFQVKVWKALLSIPPARLCTYKNVATMLGQPKASRAVGTAIGKNPIAYLIPCHRVIRQNGLLGGYRWGNHRKAAIIGYESIRMRGVRPSS